MHLHIKLSSLLLIKVYLNKISLTFSVCKTMGSVHDFPLVVDRPPEVEEHSWVGTSPASALSTPCWKAQLLQPRLASLFLHHFLPLTPTQAKAWYSKEDSSYTPTLSLSFPAPQAVF